MSHHHSRDDRRDGHAERRGGHNGDRDDERRFARRDDPRGDWLGSDGHGGRHSRHGRGGSRERGSSRFLEHGDLRYVILDLIAARPRHGYEIIKAIEDSAGGSYSPSPGVIYPTLTLLTEQGLSAVAEEDAGRKRYALTDAGRVFLDKNAAALRAVQGRIAEMQASRADDPPPAIVRAVENLKLALRLKLARGPVSDEQVRRIAEAIDAAALAAENA
jgi:DNA-binding PadR family transcriptional regulator